MTELQKPRPEERVAESVDSSKQWTRDSADGVMTIAQPRPVPLIATEVKKALDRSNYWFEQQQFEKAIEGCTSVIQLDPKCGKAFSLRGKARWNAAWLGEDANRRTKMALAMSDYDEAIRLAPNDADARLDRGWARLVTADQDNGASKGYAGALDDFESAIRLGDLLRRCAGKAEGGVSLLQMAYTAVKAAEYRVIRESASV